MEIGVNKRKNDMLLLVAIFVLGSLVSIGMMVYNKQETGVRVVVTVDGKEYGSYPLGKDATVEIEGKLGINTMEIRDGSVRMTEAVCPDLYCVQHEPIHANGEKIICLPGTIILEIRGGEESELDSIVG